MSVAGAARRSRCEATVGRMLRARRRPRRLSIFTVQAINQSFKLANRGGEVDISRDTGLGLRLARDDFDMGIFS